MLLEFLKKCMYDQETKDGYFENDHHGYSSEEAKDAEWDNLLHNMDRDFYEEYILPHIEAADKDLYMCCGQFMLYMACKKALGE